MMLDDLRRFSIHDLKRLGMLRDGYKGSIHWNQNGEKVAGIGLRVALNEYDPTIWLHYVLIETEEKISDLISLHYQPSNLPNMSRGYWMFICPVTGNPCRVLYLHQGHFKSREAIPGILYKCQTYTGYYRTMSQAFEYEEVVEKLRDALKKPYAKAVYRGGFTRKMERLFQKEERFNRYLSDWVGFYRGN